MWRNHRGDGINGSRVGSPVSNPDRTAGTSVPSERSQSQKCTGTQKRYCRLPMVATATQLRLTSTFVRTRRRNRRTQELPIEQCLSQFPRVTDEPLPPSKKKTRRRSNTPRFDLREHLYRITGVDLTAIDGLDVVTVQTIIAEVGLDPSKFATEKHFASWLGLCPNPRITGGRVKSSQTRSVSNRAATAFRLAAQAVSRSKTALGAYYRRLAYRCGAPKAITATAHKIARIFYRLWKTKQPYQDPGVEEYEQRHRDKTLKYLQKKAASLNLQLVPAQEA
jgi:transposase